MKQCSSVSAFRDYAIPDGGMLPSQGKILIGLTPENGQRTAADVTKYANSAGGIMLYALHDSGINAMAQAACKAMGLSGCSTPVLPGAN